MPINNHNQEKYAETLAAIVQCLGGAQKVRFSVASEYVESQLRRFASLPDREVLGIVHRQATAGKLQLNDRGEIEFIPHSCPLISTQEALALIELKLWRQKTKHLFLLGCGVVLLVATIGNIWVAKRFESAIGIGMLVALSSMCFLAAELGRSRH